MALLRRVLLPLLIAIAVVAQLSVGIAGASSIRADQRHAAAVAKEKRDVAGYRAKVTPLVTQVFDAVQPLQDVEDAFGSPAPGLAFARDDVLAHSGAKASLGVAAKALTGLRSPRTLTRPANELRSSLGEFTTAVQGLVAATTAKGDRSGFVAAFDPAFSALDTAEGDWLTAVEGVFGDTEALPTPAAARGGAHGRTTPTHGGYVQRTDLVCAQGEEDLFASGSVKGQAAALAHFPARAKIIARVNAQLRAVPSDAASAGYLHRSRVLLTAADAYPRAMVALSKSYAARDAAGFERGRLALIGALPRLRDLSHAFASYGANLCAQTFDVDAVLAGTGKAGSGGLST